jgi:HAD superfamily phosphoserine phosphatase-like hydrolase
VRGAECAARDKSGPDAPRTAHSTPPSIALSRLRLAARLPRYWWLDRRGRDHFLRAFYRNYAGYTPGELASLQEALFHEVTLPRLFQEGEATVRAHREAGQRVVILSASLRFVLEPLAGHLAADELICQELSVRNGALTGELEGLPLSGEERAARLDSSGDIPMLAAVGHPVAVNPTRTLWREAQRRGWRIVQW